MSQSIICPRCAADDLVEGALQSTGTMHFRPVGVPFLTFRTADVAIRACMCPGCGTVTLLGDVEKLRLILQTPEAQSAGSRRASACP